MFGIQFYPTPKKVIKLMLDPYIGKTWKGGINGRSVDCFSSGLEGKVILDPSAGKGDILRFIQEDLKDNARRSDIDLYGVEIDENLQAILKKTDISVLGKDFLTYQNDILFDIIVMNPPFKNGDEHLLKAIEISHNTDIVCLLNAETLLNPNTNRKKQLLEQIEKFGSFEIIGNVFDTAERKTNVNVALVRLNITNEKQSFDFDFSDYEPEKITFNDTFVKNEIARKDIIGNMMIQFNQAKKAYKEYIEAQKKWEHYTSFIIANNQFKKPKDFDKQDLPPLKRYNRFNNQIKARMWRTVITELGLERYMTSKVQKNFDIFINEQSNMSFTKENVQDLFTMLVQNRATILENSITDVFELLTANYYSENRMYVEGWKTNDRYKINKKIIAPMYVQYGEYMSNYDLKQYGDKFSIGYRGENAYCDIDKTLCYISGQPYDKITTIRQALDAKFNMLGKIYIGGPKHDNSCCSTFFDIKFYKKGTVHLTFKDSFLWQEFNMRACNGKNWLPDDERTQWEKKTKEEDKTTSNGVLRIGKEQTTDNSKTVHKKKIIGNKKTSVFSKQLLDLFADNL